jgi:hypothetical protein
MITTHSVGYVIHPVLTHLGINKKYRSTVFFMRTLLYALISLETEKMYSSEKG